MGLTLLGWPPCEGWRWQLFVARACGRGGGREVSMADRGPAHSDAFARAHRRTLPALQGLRRLRVAACPRGVRDRVERGRDPAGFGRAGVGRAVPRGSYLAARHAAAGGVFGPTTEKKGALVGFHARASDTVTAVPDCLILRPELTAALPLLEELVTLAGSRKGEMALSLTLSNVGLDSGGDRRQNRWTGRCKPRWGNGPAQTGWPGWHGMAR